MNTSSLAVARRIQDFSESYEFHASVVIMTSGLFSNICLILLLSRLRVFRGNQCAFYWLVECTANIGLLSLILSSRILTYIIHRDPVDLFVVWCKIRSWSVQAFCLISLQSVCFAAFDQYLSTNHRYSFRQKSTLKLAHRLTCSTVVVATVHNIPLLIFSEIRPIEGCNIYDPVLNKYYSFFYFPLFVSGLPIVFIGSFSLLAYRNVWRLVRRQIPVVRRKLDRQLTAMVFTRSISLIALGLPYIVYSLCELNLVIREDDELGLAIQRLIEAVTLSLFYANYSINFYVFLVTSPRFRRQAKYFFVKKYFNSTRTGRNQVAPSRCGCH